MTQNLGYIARNYGFLAPDGKCRDLANEIAMLYDMTDKQNSGMVRILRDDKNRNLKVIDLAQ